MAEYKRRRDLHESNEKLRQLTEYRQWALDAAQLGAWEYRFDTGEIHWDEHCRQMFGVSEGERIDYETCLAIIHPEERDEIDRIMKRAISGDDVGHYDQEFRVVWPDGSIHWVSSHGRALPGGEGESCRPARFAGVNLDITDRKQWEQEREITIEFLRLVNASTELGAMIHAATTFFQEKSGCEAVGIRLQEGEDFPYFEARGFSKEFVLLDNDLCTRDSFGALVRDSLGNPVIECMCGNVICGRTNPSMPFFTKNGSFWTNCTTELLQGTTQADRQSTTRDRCNGEGYESVALLPLYVGRERFGLLQLNDRRKGQFTPERIAHWERLANHLAVALAKFRAEGAMRQSEARYRSLFENMAEGLAYCKMLFDDDGRPLDFTYLDVNNAFESLTGLRNVVGRRVSEVIPELEKELIETYGRVATTGIPERFEFEVKTLGIWFSIAAYCPQRSYFVAVFDNITGRKQVELELLESRRRLEIALDAAKLGVWRRDLVTGEIFWDARTRAIFRVAPDEVITYDLLLSLIVPEDREQFASINQRRYGSIDGELSIEFRIHWPDASTRWLHARGSNTRDASGKPIRITGVIMDITERKSAEQGMRALEEQLRHAQKMEAVGRLAGGIAHDFNNLLMVIGSYAELLHEKLPADDSSRKNTQQILRATDRAAGLTAQLLAFSRKQITSSRIMDLNKSINETTNMLKRMVGEDIEFQFCGSDSLWAIKADPYQIVQVLMNLCVNSRDAMPRGGTITITTSNVTVGEDTLEKRGAPAVPPGDYVEMSVTDTGVGISKEIQDRMFEPFFTTKEVGKGTGLGLSTVYGIVDQSGGHIRVQSNIAEGACFTIYLPKAADRAMLPTAADADGYKLGTETLLVVEDEDVLRESITEFLRTLGYNVLEANSGQQAMSVVADFDGVVHLLITDVVMPRMSGRELSELLQAICPALKTIYMSGYTDDAAVRYGARDAGVMFLQKPFSMATLAHKVREGLSGRGPR